MDLFSRHVHLCQMLLVRYIGCLGCWLYVRSIRAISIDLGSESYRLQRNPLSGAARPSSLLVVATGRFAAAHALRN
jgi:hypothetical protein